MFRLQRAARPVSLVLMGHTKTLIPFPYYLVFLVPLPTRLWPVDSMAVPEELTRTIDPWRRSLRTARRIL